jgi:hypothetical protein
VLPVQPKTATGTRDVLMGAAEAYLLQDWKGVCDQALPEGRPGCLLVVADLLPTRPGEEGMLFLQRGADYTEITGLYLDDAGRVVTRPVSHADGRYVDSTEAAELMRQYLDTPPPVTAVQLNQLGTDGAGLLFLP